MSNEDTVVLGEEYREKIRRDADEAFDSADREPDPATDDPDSTGAAQLTPPSALSAILRALASKRRQPGPVQTS